jgi:alkanesulfonate monooxygenase SsuD/methylene tetrahydromethanopterin reductase-like flavin-dependent oxidoreductase (luciferase family)
MISLGGRLADGVILSGPVDYLRDAINIVNRAAEDAKRNSDDIEKVIWVPTIPHSIDSDSNLAKRVVAIVVADTPLKITDRLNLDQEKIAKIRDAVSKGGPDAGARHVDRETLEMFSIAGDISHMADRFEELYKMGATEILVGPPFSGDWRRSVTTLVAEIRQR